MKKRYIKELIDKKGHMPFFYYIVLTTRYNCGKILLGYYSNYMKGETYTNTYINN